MKLKKGVIEIQFNWLFVIIIGAVILLLFSGIILRQKKISETSTNAFVKDTLYSILSSIEVSEDTLDPIKIPETNINFYCNGYSIEGLPQQLNSINIFSPSSVSGKNILLRTLDFSIPYRITNLIYLTSPRYRYIFVGNGDAKKLEVMMSNDTFNDYFLTLDNIEYRGEEKTRFVFFGGLPAAIPIGDGSSVPIDYEKIFDEDVSAIKINGDFQSGTIEFFEKSGTSFQLTGESYYIGENILLGAVFTDDSETYNCVMDNVFEKINIVTQIYKKKVESIKDRYISDNHRCKDHSGTIYNLDNFDEILVASTFTQANSNKIINAAVKIEAQNKQAQLRSCATIY